MSSPSEIPAPLQRPVFKGSFAFVNHNAASLTTLPHRSTVHHHIQGSYNKWRRQEAARKYRESHRSLATVNHRPSSDSSGSGEQNIFSRSQKLESDAEQKSARDRNADDQAVTSYDFNLPSPTGLLKKGNSDPFNALAIEIDSTVNDVMKFTREVYVPSINRDETNPGPVEINSDWKETIDSLSDEGTAYARLARVTSVMYPNASPEALLFNKKALGKLRLRLADSQAWSDPRTFSSIKSLQAADLQGQNYPGAMFHTSILCYLLQTGIIRTDIKSLFGVFYHDYQRAALTFTRPQFDLHGWVPEQFEPIWKTFAKTLPPASVLETIVPLHLDPTIEGKPLQSTFKSVRHCLSVLMLSRKDPSLGQSSASFYLRSKMIYLLALSLNHYLDLCVILSKPTLSYDATSQIRTRIYLCLASMYWNRCAAGCDAFKIGTVSIFCANGLLTKRLKHSLIDSEIHSTDEVLTRDAHPRLWALYIGAAHEQAQLKNGPPREQWFSLKFAQQATILGLVTWQSVREVLQRFLYSDGVLLHGSVWFYKTLTLLQTGE